jgi:hypothetical protein
MLCVMIDRSYLLETYTHGKGPGLLSLTR